MWVKDGKTKIDLHFRSALFSIGNSQTSRSSSFNFIFSIKISSQNISKPSHRFRSNFTTIEAAIGGKRSWKDFGKNLPVARNMAVSKIGDGVILLLWLLQCHCYPDHKFFFSLSTTNGSGNFSKSLLMAM